MRVPRLSMPWYGAIFVLAAAAVARYGARPVFDLMLRYATSADGVVRAEKWAIGVRQLLRSG